MIDLTDLALETRAVEPSRELFSPLLGFRGPYRHWTVSDIPYSHYLTHPLGFIKITPN